MNPSAARCLFKWSSVSLKAPPSIRLPSLPSSPTFPLRLPSPVPYFLPPSISLTPCPLRLFSVSLLHTPFLYPLLLSNSPPPPLPLSPSPFYPLLLPISPPFPHLPNLFPLYPLPPLPLPCLLVLAPFLPSILCPYQPPTCLLLAPHGTPW